MSSRDNPYDKAMAESFFGRLKTEDISKKTMLQCLSI